MTVRSDITVQWHLSPRIITVADTSDEITIQDLHDTLRDLEDEPDTMIYPTIISTGGKETLVGSTSVSLTATLLNARLSFAARKGSHSTGTITTPDATGITLRDGAADFVGDGIEPGAWVMNLTDGSLCSVLVVVDQYTLLTDGLGDGIDNEFGASDSYEVRNVVQCTVSGGNIVAEDILGDPLSPILPTAGTQVLIAAASSATQIESGVSGLTNEESIQLLGLPSADEVSDQVWDEALANHTIIGTYGSELATKADIAAGSATSYVTASSGTIIDGNDDDGAWTDLDIRNNAYWEIGEHGDDGLTVEFAFELTDADCRPGVVTTFGRYIGVPSGTHYMELWA